MPTFGLVTGAAACRLCIDSYVSPRPKFMLPGGEPAYKGSSFSRMCVLGLVPNLHDVLQDEQVLKPRSMSNVL